MTKPVKTARDILESIKDQSAFGIIEGYRQQIDFALAQLEEYYKQSYSVGDMPKVNGEYQCEHVKEKILRGNCVWCNLTVAEKIIDRLKAEKKKLEEYYKPLEPIDEITAEQLHKWYLLAIAWIKKDMGGQPFSYNADAQKEYKDLTPEQQYIDKYIAHQINAKFGIKKEVSNET